MLAIWAFSLFASGNFVDGCRSGPDIGQFRRIDRSAKSAITDGISRLPVGGTRSSAVMPRWTMLTRILSSTRFPSKCGTARGQGSRAARVLYGHVFRNAMLNRIYDFRQLPLDPLSGRRAADRIIFSLDG